MTFAEALPYLLKGERLRQDTWDQHTFIYLVPKSNFPVGRPPLSDFFDTGFTINYQPHIDLYTHSGNVVVWQISQQHLFADNWSVCGSATSSECPVSDVKMLGVY